MKGLGRGKGVKVVETYSILNSGHGAVEIIKNRVLDLLELFMKANLVSPSEIYRLTPENFRDEVIEEYVNEVDELQSRLNERDELIEELSEELVR